MTGVLNSVADASYDVSVVVPIYNVERFLSECVESLLSQTLGERLQIVLVDDGSPDASGELADEYAARFDNVLCVHRENGGLGPARNTGILHARGRYIGFVDSDDWVDGSMYERLYASAVSNEADAVYSGMRTVTNGRETAAYPQPYGDRVFSAKDEVIAFRNTFFGAAPERVTMEPMQVSVCPAIYRTKIIRDFGIEFENVRSEDILFNLDYLARVARVACIDGIFYNYRKEEQASITSTFHLETIGEYFELFDRVAARLPNDGEDGYEDASLRFDRRVIDCCRGMLVSIYTVLTGAIRGNTAARVLTSDRLRDAMQGYPWYKIPLTQGIFLLAMKCGCKPVLQLLSKLRSGR